MNSLTDDDSGSRGFTEPEEHRAWNARHGSGHARMEIDDAVDVSNTASFPSGFRLAQDRRQEEPYVMRPQIKVCRHLASPKGMPFAFGTPKSLFVAAS